MRHALFRSAAGAAGLAAQEKTQATTGDTIAGIIKGVVAVGSFRFIEWNYW